MHNKRTACHAQWDILWLSGGRNNLSRPWICNDAWSKLSRNNEHRELTPIHVRRKGDGWNVGGLWPMIKKFHWFSRNRKKKQNYANQLSLYSINSKNRKSLCRNYFLEFSGSKSDERVCMRWSTFYVSEIYIQDGLGCWWCAMYRNIRLILVFEATLSCRGWRSSFLCNCAGVLSVLRGFQSKNLSRKSCHR